MKKSNTLSQSIVSASSGSDDRLAYAFTADDTIDADERYQRDPILTSRNPARDESNKSVFALLSAELSNPIHEVRTASQQAEWAEKKSICQKKLLSELLKFKSSWYALIEACNEKTEHLLGVIVQSPEGNKIEYDIRLHIVVKALVHDYLNGDSQYSLEELTHLLVEDYNLSYCHFTKATAKAFFEKFAAVDEARKRHQADSAFNQKGQQNLFCVADEVLAFEVDEGVQWDLARTTYILCRSLDTRITQLRNLLVTTNMKGCLKHAINFYFSGSGNKQSSLDQMDLFSEGIEGLMHAADMFVYGTAAKFSTYSEYWVKLKISRFIKNSYTVKIPIHVSDQVGKITRYLRDWKKENEGKTRLPNHAAVSEAINEKIADEVWQLAMLRQNSTPFSVSCVNSDGEEGFLSFDMFSEVSIDGEESGISAETQLILNVAKDLMNGISRRQNSAERGEWDRTKLGKFTPTADETGKRKPLLTPEQFQIFCMKYVYEKSHAEIAERLGTHLTSKHIRKEAERVMQLIRFELNIKVDEE